MSTQIGTITLGNGVNLQPSYYNNGDVNFAWDLMAEYPNIKSVRIEIEPNMAHQAAGWIAQAKSHGKQVIATYHNKNIIGKNNPDNLVDAAIWWRDNYSSLGGGFIINLANEWSDHNIDVNTYASAYNTAIATMRHFYSGYIIIDVPGWGQDISKAYQAVKPGAPLIKDKNIVLSVHIYKASWNSGTGKFLAPADLDLLAKTGLPCIVGEFGVEGKPTETCDWSACVDHAKALHWSVIGWCWNGDGQGYNMVSPDWSEDPTATTHTVDHTLFDTIYGKL